MYTKYVPIYVSHGIDRNYWLYLILSVITIENPTTTQETELGRVLTVGLVSTIVLCCA